MYAAARYKRFQPEAIARKRRADRERRTRVYEHVLEYLNQHPCLDCGERDPVVLEFDHVGEKRGNVSELVTHGLSWTELAREIANCEIRCGNCHRRKTIERGDYSNGVRKLCERPGQDSNPRHAASKAAANSAEPPGHGCEFDDIQPGTQVRVCSRCFRVRSVDRFYLRSRSNRKHSWCRDCHNLFMRGHYAANRDGYIARVTRNKTRTLAENAPRVLRYLLEHPCTDCGESDARVLEFDHLRDKRSDVTALLRAGYSWELVEAEIAKCEVRCVNCHRRRTAMTRGFYRQRATDTTNQRRTKDRGSATPARLELALPAS